MILDLDKLKAAGEIPDDLDAEIQRIMGLREMCEGPLDPDEDYCNYACSVCGSGPTAAYGENEPELRKIEIQLESGPYQAWKWFREHSRIPLPYSSDLVASRKVLEWLETAFNFAQIERFATKTRIEKFHRISVEIYPDGPNWGRKATIKFADLCDEPLAIAVAVHALFEEPK